MIENEMRDWIVVVDDDAMSLTSVRTLLAAEDMKISCLPSGKSLLKFMTKNDPDLILLDVMMPEFDGFQTFEALREQEKRLNRPETPIIFLTGDADHETERNGLKLGASDYIHKPFNKDILISRIRNTIDKSKILENLKEDAAKDKLTGFFNKAEGVLRIKYALVHFSGSLMMLDFDNFKPVNDLYGHEKGDQILREFADLVRQNTKASDILCRIGGDEFLLFVSGLYGEAAVSSMTAQLNASFAQRAKQVLGADHGIPLGISVGAVTVPEYGTDYDQLFRMADEAMYRTKQNGKHGYTVYEDSEVFANPLSTPEEELSRIIKIIEERYQGREPLILGTDAFSTVFQFVERLTDTYETKALILLFILIPRKAVDDTVLNDALVSFGEVLKRTLGKCDVIMKGKNNQFLVLHPMLEEGDFGRGREEGENRKKAAEPEWQAGAEDQEAMRAQAVIDKILSVWEGLPEGPDFEVKIASQIR